MFCMKKVVLIVSILLLLGGIIAGTGYYFVFYPNTRVADDGIIYVKRGATVDSVFDVLQSRGYIKNIYTLRKVADMKKYSLGLKNGRYKIPDGLNNNQLINFLRSGKQEAVKFTFNNIRTMDDFASGVSAQLDITPDEIVALADSNGFVHELGFTKENFIGMFIPNTYEIYWNIPARDFIGKMNREYKKFWNEERREKAEEASLSPMDVTILASIIEEETVQADEYPVIAGVYINRLHQNIPLSACPTLKFAWGDFTLKRILNKHLEIDSPYNTYKYTGLPPGPVRMPSVNVIDAVLNYQKHDYLFFCAKSDFSGRHNFSKTLRQHNEYAKQYHAELNKRKIY